MTRAHNQAWQMLAWFHRWAGVMLCLLFADWFASGAILLFVPYPSLGGGARWESTTPIDMSRLDISPSAVTAAEGDIASLRLVSLEGQPVYVASHAGRADRLIAGDSGKLLAPLSAAAAKRIAESFMGRNASAISEPIVYDQWVVPQGYDPQRPFYRADFADAERTELYVSARTGEVLQKTTGSVRFWNWLGSVPHWIYFTPIRSSWTFWDRLVWWISLVATASAAAGFALGIYRTFGIARQRRALSPFRAWLRWHHTIGLFAGIFVLTWILSGWLSMDHGRLFSTGEPSAEETARMAGAALADVVASVPLASLRSLDSPSEIRFSAVASRPTILVAKKGSAPAVYTLRGDVLEQHDSVPSNLLFAGIQAAWPNAAMKQVGTVATDSFYAMAEEMGGVPYLFESQAGPRLSIYVDGRSGRVLKVMDKSRRAYAWIYYALHTMRVPALASREALRVFIILTLLAIGFGFSVTGVVIGVNRLYRDAFLRRR